MMLRILRNLFLLFAVSAGCAESQRAPGSSSVPADARYVASTRGRVYYAAACDGWRRLAPGNLIWFGSAAEAEEAGYTPSAAPGCAPESRSDPGAFCTVASVTDGDTLVCEGGVRVRLLLIDSPEMDQGEFGELARAQLLALAPPGTPLRVELDVERRDRYGRTLAYLHTPDGRFVNEEMARAGYAVPLTYPPNVRHVERILSAVVEAREARAGLWGTPAFECPPVDHRAGRCDGG